MIVGTDCATTVVAENHQANIGWWVVKEGRKTKEGRKENEGRKESKKTRKEGRKEGGKGWQWLFSVVLATWGGYRCGGGDRK